MIIGTGCDIVEHETAKCLKWDSDLLVQQRIFTPKELEIFEQKKDIKFLAGRFAAKEAVLKCLGTGMQDGIALTNIEILQSETEMPIIQLSDGAKEISDVKRISSWHVSISHSNKYSIAFAIAEKL
jgi:holo-[acyl-carrier protein] synthase